MAAKKVSIIRGAGYVAVMAICWAMVHEHVEVACAFQTPIIFPLLWIAKRLTHHDRIGAPPPFPLMPPLAGMKSLVAMNQKSDNTERMVEWLEELDEGGTFTSSVTVNTNDQGIRGLIAKKDIKSGEIIVEVPYDAALLVGDTLWGTIFDDFEDVPESDGWSDDDLDDVYQGLNFLSTFVKGYDFAPYINNLPKLPSSGDEAGLTPDFWSKEVILGLEVPSYVKQILERKQIVQEVAKKNNVDENELRWATWMMRSRRFTTWNMVNDPNSEDEGFHGAFPFKQKKIEQIQGFLLPLIDMANHNHDPNAALRISVNRWTREFDDSSTFALRATKPISKGEEVTISYGDGDRTSLDFIDKYGFFLKGNDADKEIDWEELKPEFTTSLEQDQAELATYEDNSHESKTRVYRTKDKLKTIVSKIQDYEPSFSSNLDGLELIGSGMRQKMGIKVYAVAMYGASSLLDATSRQDLQNSAKSFSAESPRTTFVLEMILQADAETVADAIADSVKLRYGGPQADVTYLKSLIADGVREEGGQATKGSVLQFDCTQEGVTVSVSGADCGSAKFTGLGSAFVDVFLDEDTVSISLVENCLGMDGSQTGVAEESNTAIRKGPESRRAMLSLRVLMKQLSNFRLEPSAASTNDDSESVVNGAPAPNGEVETSTSADVATSNESVSTPESLTVDVATSNESGSTTPESNESSSSATAALPPESGIAADDSSFDASGVEAKIRLLEFEIQAEIARVQSLGVQPGEVSGVTQDTTAAVPASPAAEEPNVEIAAQESGEAAVASTTEAEAEKTVVEVNLNSEAVESKMKLIKEKATSVQFDPKLEDGLYLVGAGVRKKAIINVYAVAMYSSPLSLEALSPFARGKQKKEAQSALRNAARTFGPSSPKTTFVLEMTFKADAQTIAGAIAEGVKPRYGGSPSDVKVLEDLIIQGVKSKGGQATKGTVFRFDCTEEGVRVSVDGNEQGVASFDGMGSAFVDVFMDDKAVSPQLTDSCLDTWAGVL